MRTTTTATQFCVWCASEIDAHSNWDGATVKPGDVTLCLYCGGVMRFGQHLELDRIELHRIPQPIRRRVRRTQREIRRNPIRSRHHDENHHAGIGAVVERARRR